jgi:hypothetical protein
MNIGWALFQYSTANNTKRDVIIGHTRRKECLGYIWCPNCDISETFRRPVSDKKKVKAQKCGCGATMKHVPCAVKVKFIFKNGECLMVHEGTHCHGEYRVNHLTDAQKEKLDQNVAGRPNMTAKEAVGVFKDGSLDTPLCDSVSKSLINVGVAKHYIAELKKRQGIVKKGQFLGELP